MEEKELLKKLCLTDAPSGREHWIYPVVKEAFQPYGKVSMGNLNNIYVCKKGIGRGKIMLMAHSDEVFLMITKACDRGFFKFKAVGIDPKTLVSQEVTIHGKEKICGIIGITPPHLMSEEDKNSAIKIDQLMIDTGYSKDKLSDIVKIGDFVTIKREFYLLANDNVTCKAIDDRAGIVAMYSCAKELEDIKHDLDVYFVCSAQEEVGHRGGKIGAYEIEPDIGIAIDVTFDSGKFGDEERENELGKGPVICVGPNVHSKLKDKILELAREYNIPYGVEVEPGNTGTDAWDIQISKEGIPTLLISIPIKYMHTSVEVVNLEDIKNTGKLLAKLIETLKVDQLEELLCF